MDVWYRADCRIFHAEAEVIDKDFQFIKCSLKTHFAIFDDSMSVFQAIGS